MPRGDSSYIEQGLSCLDQVVHRFCDRTERARARQRAAQLQGIAPVNPNMLRVQSILEPGPCDDEETTEEITRENIEQMQQDLWKGNWGRPNPSARKQYFKGHVWGKKKG